MIRYLSVLFIFGYALGSAQGAEDEFIILNFDSDLIGPIEHLDTQINDALQASQLIQAYHQLLSAEVKAEVEALHAQMVTFIPGFEVAYTAADSAEFSHLMDEMDVHLAAIQNLHAQKYTRDVVSLLTEAYKLILPTFGDSTERGK